MKQIEDKTGLANLSIKEKATYVVSLFKGMSERVILLTTQFLKKQY